jgi:hypothetical protein
MPCKPLAALLAAALSFSAQAESVVCHLNYGGETWHIEAQPSTTPYTVAPTPVGSFFLFRIVFRQEPAGLASIKLYTYADRESGPLLIHQASYAYPLGTTADPAAILRGAVNGFSGLNFVYEPQRDSELQYWCELNTEAAK